MGWNKEEGDEKATTSTPFLTHVHAHTHNKRKPYASISLILLMPPFVLAFLFFSFSLTPTSTSHLARPLTKLPHLVILLISFDGFRFGYQFKAHLPNTRRLIQNGTEAETGLIPVFPALTFPVTTPSLTVSTLPTMESLITSLSTLSPTINSPWLATKPSGGSATLFGKPLSTVASKSPPTSDPALRILHLLLRVYLKEALPLRLHYAANDRIPPIIGLVDEGFKIEQRRTGNKECGGEHGYDNAFFFMRTIFIGHGPQFARERKIHSFENVEIYNLVTSILNIKGGPNNGSASFPKSVLLPHADHMAKRTTYDPGSHFEPYTLQLCFNSPAYYVEVAGRPPRHLIPGPL
ncbi:hypothetical protein VNO77_34348 [Canavalia gladiata]|uniref:Uncharacterized protein n=1 Tax=Canavalia gladiata TaxID=3824 RepID=A0AAN9KHD8_CANGL